jgi:hypothetical protein
MEVFSILCHIVQGFENFINTPKLLDPRPCEYFRNWLWEYSIPQVVACGNDFFATPYVDDVYLGQKSS